MAKGCAVRWIRIWFRGEGATLIDKVGSSEIVMD